MIIPTAISPSSVVHAQNLQCDSIYESVDVLPSYTGGDEALSKYLTEELQPALQRCAERDDQLTTKLGLILTIDGLGNVSDVEFQAIRATSQCKEELRQKLMGMTG